MICIMMWLVKNVPLSLDGLEMKFSAYSISPGGSMAYIGTWYEETYDLALAAIVKETGLDPQYIKIYGRI